MLFIKKTVEPQRRKEREEKQYIGAKKRLTQKVVLLSFLSL